MKRKRRSRPLANDSKRQKLEDPAHPRIVTALLRKHYTSVQTLREYLVSHLYQKSRRRANKLKYLGTEANLDRFSLANADVVHLLDSTLVGTFDRPSLLESTEDLDGSLTLFTQQITATSTSHHSSVAKLTQAEIVDFTIWSIFRGSRGVRTPNHLLCYGYQSNAAGASRGISLAAAPGIPGIFRAQDNGNVETLKSHPWTCLYDILAMDADRLIHSLLTVTSVFVPVVGGKGFRQLSGIPLTEVTPLPYEPSTADGEACVMRKWQRNIMPSEGNPSSYRKPSAIRFPRHRMLYARPERYRDSDIRLGLPRKHVLERIKDVTDRDQTIHIMKYVFPHLMDSVTVEYSRMQGQSFYRKTLQ
ncbi:hypothetical protein K431DRAFT_215597 [Polychaeton citri CBS 116435]|uniref:Telomerase reverse transcriptase n=1 Tax=Polychaeton citri CBS 116435 TaxID=1314669 RepID=A0A9P4QH24_9PEZI|nr:hypothetical protein K431DRAFT_215597 [Polychaeton citri CBS 116435]